MCQIKKKTDKNLKMFKNNYMLSQDINDEATAFAKSPFAPLTEVKLKTHSNQQNQTSPLNVLKIEQYTASAR